MHIKTQTFYYEDEKMTFHHIPNTLEAPRPLVVCKSANKVLIKVYLLDDLMKLY